MQDLTLSEYNRLREPLFEDEFVPTVKHEHPPMYYSFKNSAGGVEAYHSFEIVNQTDDLYILKYAGVWNSESNPHFNEYSDSYDAVFEIPRGNVWEDENGELQLGDFPVISTGYNETSGVYLPPMVLD